VVIRAISFDLFDTLVDLLMEELPEFRLGERTMRGTLAQLHEVTSAYCELDLESFVSALRASDRRLYELTHGEGRELPTLRRFRDFARTLGVDGDALPRQLTETHMRGIQDVARYLPGHVQVLRELGGQRRLGVCSNFSHTPTALAVLGEAQLTPHLDAIVISEQVGIRKPRPEIFEEVVRGLGARPEETLHVGDKLEADVRGAARVGLSTAWITRRVRDPEAELAQYDGPEPTYVIADLAELVPLLDETV
jgi:HAD superfamily hydrolase (TIGR01549 family)